MLPLFVCAALVSRCTGAVIAQLDKPAFLPICVHRLPPGRVYVQVGASKVYVEDLRQDFLHNYIFPSIQANGEHCGSQARYGTVAIVAASQPGHALSSRQPAC